MNKQKILTADDCAAIEARITALETKTSGEVVVAVAERSSYYRSSALLLAVIAAGMLTPLCTVPTASFLQGLGLWASPAQLQTIVYVPVFFILLAAFRWLVGRMPFLLNVIVSDRKKQDKVSERAQQVFFGHRLFDTAGKTGVLIYLSRFERSVHILADAGIYAKLGQDELQAMVDKVVAGVRSRSAAQGILAVLDKLEPMLAEGFPKPDKNPDELPNAVIFC